MNTVKNFILNNKYYFLILFLYFIISVFTLFNHEIWRDEAQVWCIVRDLNFIDVLKTARIEGHPFLWYILLFPFAKLGCSVYVMQFLSWLFVLASVVFFLFKAPFNNFFKTIVIFSSGMLYFFPVIARNYSLIPLSIFLLAYFYPKRKENPFIYSLLIILCSQTHILVFGFSGILFVLFGIEKLIECFKNKKISDLYPVLILSVYFLFMLLLFMSVPAENKIIENYLNLHRFISYTIINFIWVFCNIVAKFNYLIYIFYLLAVVILYNFFKADKKIFLIYTLSSGFIFYVLNKFWFGGIPYQKVFVSLLILLFCYWVLNNDNKTENKKYLKYSIYLIFIISFITSFPVIYKDIKYNFSGSKEISEYIKQNIKEENTFMVIGLPYTFSSISAYLPDKKLFYIPNNQYITYYNFEKNGKEKTKDNYIQSDYVIVQDDIIFNESNGYKEIYKTSNINLSTPIEKEIYILYKKTEPEKI